MSKMQLTKRLKKHEPDLTQPENIGPQDISKTFPPASPERPLKILSYHPEDVLM